MIERIRRTSLLGIIIFLSVIASAGILSAAEVSENFDPATEHFYLSDTQITFFDADGVEKGFLAEPTSDIVLGAWHRSLLTAQAMGQKIIIVYDDAAATCGGLYCVLRISNPGRTVVATIPTNGLVLHLPLAGDTNDTSGNGNHGTPTDITYVTDADGNTNGAAYFNGTTSRVVVPHSSDIDLSSPYTIFVEIRADSVSDRNGRFLNKGVVSSDFWSFLQKQSGQFSLQSCISGSGQTINLSSGSNVVAGAWYKLGISSDGSTSTMYINGSAVDTSTASWETSLLQNTYDIWIGKHEHYTSTGDIFKGTMKNLLIYNRSLSASEHQQLGQ